jgi:hypothetical protein
MGKKISEIYAEYKIMPVLERHMIRVAAVASIICDNFNEPFPKEEIICACLLHDMGNIIKFNLDYFPQFNEPEGIEFWQNAQKEFIIKYGKDEHKATVRIMSELGMSANIIQTIDKITFLNICNLRDGDDMNAKIIVYADNRVDPHGVVSYDERLNEAKVRYKDRPDAVPDEYRQKIVACGKAIEKQIFLKCKIKPEEINNESVAAIISELRNFVIR